MIDTDVMTDGMRDQTLLGLFKILGGTKLDAKDLNEVLDKNDLTTGIGMLTVLTRLGLIHPPDTRHSDSDGDMWRPAFINRIGRTQHRVDNYIVSDNNRALYDLLKYKVAKENKHRGEIFYVRAQPGIGKSHLLISLEGHAKRRACLINVGDLELELERALRTRERAELYKWILSFDILLLDDLQQARDNNMLQTELRRLIVHQIDRQGIVVAVGNSGVCSPAMLAPELGTVLDSGTMLTLSLPDENARRRILDTYFGEDIPDDAAEYLAMNVSRSVRQLLGATTQLISLSEQTGTPITKDMARAVLPLPSDLQHPTSLIPSAGSMFPENDDANKAPNRADFFREILAAAENEEEQALALQIAIGQRLRELREQEINDETVLKMEMALSLLRDGKLEEAITCIG